MKKILILLTLFLISCTSQEGSPFIVISKNLSGRNDYKYYYMYNTTNNAFMINHKHYSNVEHNVGDTLILVKYEYISN